MKGYIQVYTGNGKGKTTAALGLAMRAAGAGKKVFIAQFVKGMHYSELDLIKKHLPMIEIRQYGRKCFINENPVQEDIDAARTGLEEVADIISSKKYNVIILDEATIALHFNLFPLEYLLTILRNKPDQTEIVITGRYASPELEDMADLVTEMREVKHYYQSGVEARKGIEY